MKKHYFCKECTIPILISIPHFKRHLKSNTCKAKIFEALKLNDIIPGKGKNRHSNFMLFLGGFEDLKSKNKA